MKNDMNDFPRKEDEQEATDLDNIVPAYETTGGLKKAIDEAREDIKCGRVYSHAEVMAEMKARYQR